MPEEKIVMHPVQVPSYPRGESAQINSAVTLLAYEVYCHVFSPQPALVKDGCRGGFGSGELIAFLYARSFPKSEWRDRFDEAVKGMRGLG